jgi:predicted AAA+ superfamily ATPase
MNSYLFSGCMDDPVTRGLAQLRENGDALAYMAAFARLLDFAGTEGVTAHTAREYCVRMILEVPGAGGLFTMKSLAAYLEQDIAALYEIYFAPDWNALCREKAVLPPPPGASKGASEEYTAAMGTLVAAASAQELQTGLTAFLAHNADYLEAMYPVQRWDGKALAGVPNPDPVTFQDLGGLAYQKRALMQNTKLFLEGGPAGDVLLVGSGGTGKSSCVKATLNLFATYGLRLVELPRVLVDTLPGLFRVLRGKRRRYIVYIDDLTFETADASYLGLKVAMEGAAEARPRNALIYATSNRRHLVNDPMADDLIRQAENEGQNLSLAGRFGVHLNFSNLTLSEYNDVLELLFSRQGVPFSEDIARSAAAWSATNGGRSGRSAKQFVGKYLSKA